jgi:predicted metal-dependent phosphoesterase TrpH
VIDLHSHTTASDGYLDATTLVREAWTAGIRTLAVTDHDTVAAIGSARDAATAFGLTLVNGIEITAIDEGATSTSWYFFAPDAPALARCLAASARRAAPPARDGRTPGGVRRRGEHRAVAGRHTGRNARWAGRRWRERWIAEGHVRSPRDAFDTWIGEGRPAWVRAKGRRCAKSSA